MTDVALSGVTRLSRSDCSDESAGRGGGEGAETSTPFALWLGGLIIGRTLPGEISVGLGPQL
jgi:hypothetical protein